MAKATDRSSTSQPAPHRGAQLTIVPDRQPATSSSMRDDLRDSLAALPLPARFAALRELVNDSCDFTRSLAYEGLADLHREDLCYETRARLVLRDAMKNEQGLSRARIRALMKRC